MTPKKLKLCYKMLNISILICLASTFIRANSPSQNINKTMTENFSWYFYRSDHLISDKSQFRDTRTFDGYNIFHFHKNSAGFFRTFSKCPSSFKNPAEFHPVHTKISNDFRKKILKYIYFFLLYILIFR